MAKTDMIVIRIPGKPDLSIPRANFQRILQTVHQVSEINKIYGMPRHTGETGADVEFCRDMLGMLRA